MHNASPHIKTPRGGYQLPPRLPRVLRWRVVTAPPPPGDTPPGDAAHKNPKSNYSSTKLGNLCPAEKSS